MSNFKRFTACILVWRGGDLNIVGAFIEGFGTNGVDFGIGRALNPKAVSVVFVRFRSSCCCDAYIKNSIKNRQFKPWDLYLPF